MTTREQLTHERLEALIETLVAAGVIDTETADELEATRDLGEGREIARAARNGDVPGRDVSIDDLRNRGEN